MPKSFSFLCFDSLRPLAKGLELGPKPDETVEHGQFWATHHLYWEKSEADAFWVWGQKPGHLGDKLC